MQRHCDPDTDALLRDAASDDAARHRLLARHRERLHRMVTVRMDPRLRPRVDPSDVVQDVLAKADGAFHDYLAHRALPFYTWLRRMAWDRLVDLYRHHVLARRRSVSCEKPSGDAREGGSVCQLADWLVDSHTSPSRHLLREELQQRVRAALDRLGERDREVLVLRHLEQLSTQETAAVLATTEGVVRMRHLRALQRLRSVLAPELGECVP